MDATPAISGSHWHQNYSTNQFGDPHNIDEEYLSYQLETDGSRLIIRPRSGSGDLTIGTNVVWVGEKMDLECVFSPPRPWIPPITGYSWEIGGDKIKDWVLGGPGDAMGNNNRTAMLIQWDSNLDRTNASTKFVWVQDSINQTVSCTVNVSGQTIVARAKFEVRRPVATWTLTPRSSVAVVPNVCDPNGNASPYYHLCVGRNCEPTTVGMVFEYAMTDLKGYTGPFKTSFLQLVKVDWLANFSEPPWGTAQPGGFYSSEKRTKGIDTQYPYKDFGSAMSGITSDSPATLLLWSTRFEWRTDEFETYLLWQPTRGPSIPVPLKIANWQWRGQARRVNTNSPPVWNLGRQTINPQAATGVDIYLPPTWTNNVRYVPAQYNTYWFTEP
jgi:hypothetical protein